MDARIPRRYATALYDIADKRDSLEPVSDDVDLLERTFRENPRLLSILNNPQVSHEQKKAIFRDLFQARISLLTLQFCYLLVDKRRVGVLANLHAEFQQLADAAAGIIRARVQTAVPLSEEQETRMVRQLSRITGKTVVIQSTLEPSLRGGVVVWIGDRVIDGSIQGYLNSLAARLV